MSEQTVIHLLALIGSLAYMSQAMPAAVRLLRTKGVGGVSGPALEVLMISSVWWLAYSIEIGNIPSTVSSAIGLVGTVIAVVTLARLGGLGSRAPLAITAGLGLLLLVWDEPMVIGAVAAEPARCTRSPRRFGCTARSTSRWRGWRSARGCSPVSTARRG